jgi:hypothetical protein
MSLRQTWVSLLLLSCAGTVFTPGADAGAGADGGATDAGALTDGGPSPDAGSGVDAGHPARGVTVGDFTGVNALIVDAVADLAPLGAVREYHNWLWLGANDTAAAYPNTLYTPNLPAFGWDWDALFAGLKAAGASGFPAVQGGASWVNGQALPPVNAGADPTAAASYVAHGQTLFQLAARWGHTHVPDAQLLLTAEQTRLTGLGTVQYFEDFNEQDLDPGFDGAAFAAMASADLDGDQGRLGPGIGLKAADPTASLVMGGLSGGYGGSVSWVDSITAFLEQMRTWSVAHRGGSFPVDVLNVHYYSFGAVSPEADQVQQKLAAVVAWRDAHLPGLPVWWTEFGYDTFAQSPLHAPALGANSAFVVQAQWLVRDELAALAAGIARATVFELDDTCTPPEAACTTQFATCGLLRKDGSRKPAWYFLAAFRARLSTMTFTGEASSGASDVRVMRFADTVSTKGALVVWSPTSSANVHAGYALTVPAGLNTVRVVELVDQQQHGAERSATVTNGTVTLDVTETPTIVLVDSAP